MDMKPQNPRRRGGIRAQKYEDKAKMEITVQFRNQVGEMKCPDRVLVRSASLDDSQRWSTLSWRNGQCRTRAAFSASLHLHKHQYDFGLNA